jgi:hypothetical protein
MERKRRSPYPLILSLILLACAYPVYMGVSTLIAFLLSGAIHTSEYPRYVIPYAPLSFALIIATALLPAFMKRFKRHALLFSTAVGILIFFAFEIGSESMQVSDGAAAMPLDAWQYSLCIATPEVLKALGEPVYVQGNPAFKLHFYFIALVILLCVLHTAYGFMKMHQENSQKKKKPLVLQLVSIFVFIGLCIWACFTAFYRNGTLKISPLSASLMIVFFLAFGIACGLYLGCLTYSRKKLLSLFAPAIAAAAATLFMYLGELTLTNGILFQYGNGFFFQPLGGFAFAPVDLAVILISFAATYLILASVSEKT